MPPFRLEVPDHGKPCEHRMKVTLYSKKNYNPGIKVTEWEKHAESLPIDIDPYNPKDFNLHYSHYNHLGVEDKTNYTSTTQEMLPQIYTRRPHLEINPNKALVNLYSNIDNSSVDDDVKVCSSAYSADYTTSMQHSFQPPYPFRLRRLTMPETPYFANRRLKNSGICKFLDDDFILHTKRLQHYKTRQHISFNPGTGYYTNEKMEF